MQLEISGLETAIVGHEEQPSFSLKHSSTNQNDRVRYIGSKVRITDRILDVIGMPTSMNTRLWDPFCGSGAVSREAALRGWQVMANDYLISSTFITKARLVAHPEVPFVNFGSYELALHQLNNLCGIEGPIFNEYSPSGKSSSGHIRKYFTEENAKKIDSIRATISDWRNDNQINNIEFDLLVATLLAGVNQVANTAGTYGCFLKEWSPNSIKPLILQPITIHKNKLNYTVTNHDAFEVSDLKTDIIYMDPPYTKRQYPAYYHLLETIAIGDYPHVSGVTGLRPWEDKSSPFCFKRKALNAFKKFLNTKRSELIFISYSSQGHIAMDDLIDEVRLIGDVKVFEIGSLSRYAPNTKARSNGTCVEEYLIRVNKK